MKAAADCHRCSYTDTNTQADQANTAFSHTSCHFVCQCYCLKDSAKASEPDKVIIQYHSDIHYCLIFITALFSAVTLLLLLLHKCLDIQCLRDLKLQTAG